MTDKVSVIIPSFNRFSNLINAVDSVKSQTHKNVEIIVVNDCSTQEEYYTHDFGDIIVIHLKENSKKIFGCGSPGYVKNHALKILSGDYVAFLDDDDMWFPNKLELQLKAMKDNDCQMSCTEGLIGKGIYDSHKSYEMYNKTLLSTITSIHLSKGSNLMVNGFPKIWDINFVKFHNSCINSSVVLSRDIVTRVGNFTNRHPEDYNYWISALQYTNCVYVDEICFYYDTDHGGGRNF